MVPGWRSDTGCYSEYIHSVDNGIYSAEVTWDNGCAAVSDDLDVMLNGRPICLPDGICILIPYQTS